MKPLRHNEEVLEFAARHAPSEGCARAIRDGHALVFPVPELKGWHVKVRSERGRTWKIGVYCNEEERKYEVKYHE